MKYKTPFIWKNGGTILDGDLAFQMYSRFGLPPDVFADQIDEKYPSDCPYRMLWVMRAYDNFHNTNYSERFKQLVANLPE